MNNISDNGFSLEILVNGSIPAKTKFIGGAYYIMMNHNQEYKIMLTNDNNTRADADVWIDNQMIGSWRLNPHSSITIERPAEFNRKFLFLQEGTTIANRSGIVNQSNNNGLIKVLFKPELITRQPLFNMRSPAPASASDSDNQMYRTRSGSGSGAATNDTYSLSNARTTALPSYSHGATALGNQSNQRYTNATPIYNYDRNNFVTIVARMIIDNNNTYNNQRPVAIRKAYDDAHPYRYPKRLDYGMFDDNYEPAHFIERFTQ